jgi:hypothetical protein
MTQTIILIRHAEKIEWEKGLLPSSEHRNLYVDNHKLSAKGYERAQALVGYFLNRKEMVDLLAKRPLSCIIAQDVDQEEGWGRSERPLETIWYLDSTLKLFRPLLQYSNSNSLIQNPLELRLFTKSQVSQIPLLLNDPKYQNKTILISWCHQQLPAIVSNLGVDPAPKWPKGRFDITWVININKKSVDFQQYPQCLMFGDSPI